MELVDKKQLSKSRWLKANDFLLSVSSADSIKELNTGILEEIPALIPFGNSGIFMELSENFIPTIVESVNSAKKWNDSFNEYYYKISNSPGFDKNIFYANIRALKRYHNSEYYNDFLVPQDISYSAGFMISALGNKPSHIFVLNRTKGERMYTEEELSLMKIIEPHISGYYRMLSLLESFKKLPVLMSELETDSRLLSRREAEITHLLLQRLKPDGIAKELKISILTVRKHIQNIYEKLNVSDRKQLFQKIHLNFNKND
ncbi:MAG: helix-turn-helix transcriptional regulator [Spirochaetota bacterium]